MRTPILETTIIEPKLFGDNRGFFYESYNAFRFANLTGTAAEFVQENHSRLLKNTLHHPAYQLKKPQGKLIRVIFGEIFNVVIDMRKNSPTFGNWAAHMLSVENRIELWIPPGLAHGFLVMSEYAEFLCKMTEYVNNEDRRAINWNDPTVGIQWPLQGVPSLHPQNLTASPFEHADAFD